MLLFLCAPPAWAQSPEIVQEERGQLSLPFGVVYVPPDLIWQKDQVEDGLLLVGKGPDLTIAVVALEVPHNLDTSVAVTLIEKYLDTTLPKIENQLQLQDVLGAPYPWSDSLEVRLKRDPPISVYLGSGSGKTLIVTAMGSTGPDVANAIAGSFKENFSVRRESAARGGSAEGILSMLGTASTMLLLVALFLPMAVVVFSNRRLGERKNPYRMGLIGLSVGLLLCFIFDYTVLSKFSWAGFGAYASAMGGGVARFAFLLILVIYFYRRWKENLEVGE